MTGHLLGGADALEAIATRLSINTNLILPTKNIEKVEEKIDVS